MAFVTFLLLLLLSFTTIAIAQQRQFNISQGSSLTPTTNSSWLSPSGLYAFGFYKQGNGCAVGVFIAGIPQKTVVWTANRDNSPVSGNATLRLNAEGMLVLQSADGVNTDVVEVSQSISLASMSDSGNFLLYDSGGRVMWQSFENPTDTLLPTQRLLRGDELVSSASETDHSSGIFRLKMQTDGNLVQYPVRTADTYVYAYWSSGTNGLENVTLNFDRDGRLYLLNSTGFSVKNVTDGGNPTKDTIYMLRIDADGIFRTYSYDLKKSGNWSVISTSTGDKCDPKGLCGLNSYCILNDQEAECRCLPGFDFLDRGNRTSGCWRTSALVGCKYSSANTMNEISNTVWEDASYNVLSLTNKDDCKQNCLDDCNCEVVLFKDGSCSKQKLPLRFGRRELSNSNAAFIKVGRSVNNTNKTEPGLQRTNPGKDIMIASVSFAAIGLLMLATFTVVLHRYRAWAYERINKYENVRLCEAVGPRSFTYAELEKVTDGFKEEIGRGSFGTVYKGLIRSDLKVVAVKRLERVLTDGEREFQNEVNVIGKTHHRYLVRLLGYCLEGPNRLLVYEYMNNGSLANVLFSSQEPPHFTARMEIARNIARGILYLHEECERQIIHCDIKPQNILMDDYMCPKISDFGLAKLLKPDQTNTMTGVRGTRGYVAPEWHRNMPVTVKADVYSYGIMLLEIACCRKSVDADLPENEVILVDWVYQCFENCETDKLVTEEVIDKRQFDRMIKVGLWCTLDEPSLRPSMKKVLLMLEGTVDIPTPPSPTSFLSAI